MRAGGLRHRVVLEEATETRGDYGEVTLTWATRQRCWAAIEPLGGRELVEAQQVKADVSHRVRMRFAADVSPQMRIVHGSRTLHIESVLNHGERSRELELMCSERV